MDRRAAGAAGRATEAGFPYHRGTRAGLRVPEEEEEIHDVKNRKRAGRIAATVVASLALALGVSAPASALTPYGHYGQIYCPSFMVAHLSFKDTSPGTAAMVTGVYQATIIWNTYNAYHSISAKRSGYATYWVSDQAPGIVSNVYATCSV